MESAESEREVQTKVERGRGRRSEEEAERTRRMILEAALTLFARRGFEAVSLRNIAEEAGVSHNLIRHHFRSKEGVWRAVFDATDTEYVDAMQPVVAEAAREPDPGVAAAYLLRSLMRVAARHPELVRLLVHEGAEGGERLEYMLGRMAPLKEAIMELYARLRSRGLLTQFDEKSFFMFFLMAGTTPFALSALSGEVLGKDVLTEQYADEHADRISQTVFGTVGPNSS
ncbi:MAG: TetR family transcriptional regulator [Rubrobacteraceae bacterium]